MAFNKVDERKMSEFFSALFGGFTVARAYYMLSYISMTQVFDMKENNVLVRTTRKDEFRLVMILLRYE